MREWYRKLTSWDSPPARCGDAGRYDKALLISMLCLIVVGIVMVYSSTSVVTPGSRGGALGAEAPRFNFLRKHLISVATGLFVMVLSLRVKIERLHGMAYILLIVTAVLTLLVFVPGIGLNINGARRWIRFWPSTLQPSEFVKLGMVVFLARYLSSPKFNPDSLLCYLKPLAVMGFCQAVFLKQPDFGAAVTLGLITFTLLFLAGIRLRFLLLTGALLLPLIVKLAMVPYRLKRILAFLDPWSDQQGAGYQLVQSFIALGSGGVLGTGIGQSKQKLDFLPYVNTDFIFSFLGEELGFLGVSLVLTLFAVVFYRGLRISSRHPGSFPYFLGHGLTFFIIYQTLINVAVVTGLIPTKGLPLPFISYGGSSLLANMAAVGILLGLSKGYEAELLPEDQKRSFIRRKRARMAMHEELMNRRGTGG